jgi:predicted RNA binding protein YcfA (HicA-like mRNA interferase family)
MPKIPRDISGREMAKLIKIYGYNIVKEKGSHIRLLSNFKGSEHKITIPDHKHIKIGTLNNILNDIGSYLKLSKEQLIHELFKR